MLDSMMIALALVAFAGLEALCHGLAKLQGGAR
jgi:hypothetical protein